MKRPNLATIAAFAAAAPLGLLVMTGRPEAPIEDTIASVELAPAVGRRVEVAASALAPVSPPGDATVRPELPSPPSRPEPEPEPNLEPQPPVALEPTEDAVDPARFAATRAAEERAIRTLESVANAQAIAKAMVAIDSNGDGVGEFGYFAELAGSAPHRIQGPRGAVRGPRGGTLRRTVLTREFGDLSATSGGGACEIDGYLFALHLPGARRINGRVEGLPEAPRGGSSSVVPDPDESAQSWCVYAWPVSDSTPAKRAFFIDQDGTILSTSNDASAYRRYVGHARAPKWSSAYARADMAGDLGVDGSNDGNEWTRR